MRRARRLLPIWTLRTGRMGADPDVADLDHLRYTDELLVNIRKDARGNLAARSILRHALDEHSQFWIVLRGQMSLVGPKPPPLAYGDVERLSAVRSAARARRVTSWPSVGAESGLTANTRWYAPVSGHPIISSAAQTTVGARSTPAWQWTNTSWPCLTRPETVAATSRSCSKVGVPWSTSGMCLTTICAGQWAMSGPSSRRSTTESIPLRASRATSRARGADPIHSPGITRTASGRRRSISHTMPEPSRTREVSGEDREGLGREIPVRAPCDLSLHLRSGAQIHPAITWAEASMSACALIGYAAAPGAD